MTDRTRRGGLLDVSVIVCSRNRPAMLEESLRSILDASPAPAELIVVDQSDAPHEFEPDLKAAEGCSVRYFWSREKGLSRANNFGASVASYDLMVFTHDDVRVLPNWLQELVEAMVAGGPKTVVTGRILPAVEREGGFAPTLMLREDPAVYDGRIGIDVLKPLNMGLHRSALERVGGFDVRLGPGTPFPGAEDSDLGFRLLEAGLRIAYVPSAILYHRAWREERDYLPLRWSYGVAQGAFYAKHLRLADWHMARRFTRDALYRLGRFRKRWNAEGRRALGDPIFLLANAYGALRWWIAGRRAT